MNPTPISNQPPDPEPPKTKARSLALSSLLLEYHLRGPQALNQSWRENHDDPPPLTRAEAAELEDIRKRVEIDLNWVEQGPDLKSERSP